MSIIRGRLAFEDHFTQLPNTWVRDGRIGFRARGVLALLMSHSAGWSVTLQSLADGGPDGIAAVRAAVGELEQAGYLRRERQRTHDGKLAGVDYRLYDPWEGGDSCIGKPNGGKTYCGKSNVGKSHTKKNRVLEEQISEDQGKEHIPSAFADDAPASSAEAIEGELFAADEDGAEVVESTAVEKPHPRAGYSGQFEEFWEAYPRHVGKRAAATAFARALKRADLEAILAGARRYAADRNREDAFTAHAATWLNADRWEDDPLPDRTPQVVPNRAAQRAAENRGLMERARARDAARDAARLSGGFVFGEISS